MFEWDPAKAARNQRKHGVSFEGAATVFADPLGLDGADLAHSSQELRQFRLGKAIDGRVLLVVYTLRNSTDGEEIRIISARRATRKERDWYLSTP